MKQFRSIKLKINFIILILSIFQNSFSQQLKSYQGVYKEGKATYQYYENENYERIYQGNFKYVSDYVTVVGNYDKNKRIGQWTITKILPDGDYYGFHLNGYREVVTGNYIDGKLNGLWSLKRIGERSKKVIINSQVYFKDDYLSNTFKYYDVEYKLNNNESTKLLLSGKFDSNGNFDSTWILTYSKNRIPIEDIKKFNNGFLDFHLNRKLSTGEVIETHDDYIKTVNFGKCIEEKDNIVEIYPKVFEIWRRIKTPNSYEFENPVIYTRSSDEKLLKIVRGQ